MVLGFKKQFVEPIKEGTKIHTIREDKNNRWKPGMKIHFATGVRTKNYRQFFDGYCKSVQDIQIIYYDTITEQYAEIFVDGRRITHLSAKLLMMNDGFSCNKDFFNWFNKPFKGKIIHWTDKRY